VSELRWTLGALLFLACLSPPMIHTYAFDKASLQLADRGLGRDV